MNSSSAWADGAPTGPSPLYGSTPVAPEPPSLKNSDRVTDRVTRSVNRRVSRIAQFEGKRGISARSALVIKWVVFYLTALLGCGLTEFLTAGVPYATHGGLFMLGSVTLIAATGAASTLFYVNIRTEIVEKVRHYIFAIVVVPGTLVAVIVKVTQYWEWINEGSLGSTLQIALPIVFLTTVVLPTFIFVKEMLEIRTIHRSKLDDQEAVQLWTRQDGAQR